MFKKSMYLILAAICVLAVLPVSQACASCYQVTWMYVGHRVNQDPAQGTYNRLWFQLQDEDGHWAGPQDLLDYVMLIDPNGDVVTLTERYFDPNFYWNTYYDGNAGQWQPDYYPPDPDVQGPHYEAGYAFHIPATLIKGIYYLEVGYGGCVSEMAYNFTGQIALPIISNTAVKTPTLDSAGNLLVSWTPADALFQFVAKNRKVSFGTRIFIEIYNDSNYIGYAWFSMPTFARNIFVRKEVVDWMRTQGNSFKLNMHLRTNDNSNRTYSKKIDITKVINP